MRDIQSPDQSNLLDNKKLTAKCRFCKSENIIRNGSRKTQNRGKIQRYICKDCNKSFCVDDGFFRMRNSDKIIAMSIDMYLSNLSSRKMRNQLMRHFEHKISHVSILDWVRRYVLKVKKYVDSLNPICESACYLDETEIKRKKNDDVFWCAVDWNTRYISATLYSPNHQNVDDAKQVMRQIKKKGIPRYIQTDALPAYPKAFLSVFRSGKSKKDIMTRHVVNNVSKSGKHNVRIETVFSKIKDRVKDFRGLKALWSAPILLAGIVLQHNFIESHTTTGFIPADLAFCHVDTGVNRWLGLIKLSVGYNPNNN